MEDLGPRERQIMAIIYRLGRATATEVQAELPVSPSNSAVRGMLRLLEEKGHLKHRLEGRAFVYESVKPAESTARGALHRLMDVFFSGSAARVVSSLLDGGGKIPSAEELDRMEQLIQSARERQKKKQ